MQKTKQQLFAWHPGVAGYDHDDTLMAIGLRSAKTRVSLREIILWLGKPDKVSGDVSVGEVVYFFDESCECAASFRVRDGILEEFGTIARDIDNARRTDSSTGQLVSFNVLDEMVPYVGSIMEKDTEQLGGSD